MHLRKRSYTGDWLIFRPCVPSHAARPNRPKNVPVPFAAPEENVTRSVTSTACRRGFSLLELGVAMAVLGLALVGMFPLVIMYSRGLTKLEQSSPMQNVQGSSATWYLIPSSDAWARKLGAAAQLTSDQNKLLNYVSPSVPPPLTVRNDSPTADSDGDGIMDYSDPGWTYGNTSSAYNGDYHYTNALSSHSQGGQLAVWSFYISTPGWYAIQATWPSPQGLQLTTVQYQISLGGTPISGSPFNIDQTNTSAGIPDETGLSLVWCKLTPGLVHLTTSGLLQVQLSNVQPNSNTPHCSVIADAVRLVQNDVQVVSLDRSLNSQNLTVHVSITPRICQ